MTAISPNPSKARADSRPHPTGFLAMKEVHDAYDIPFVSDEVQSGWAEPDAPTSESNTSEFAPKRSPSPRGSRTESASAVSLPKTNR